MAKRWLLAFLVAILLVGCAVEQPPVYVTYTPAPTATATATAVPTITAAATPDPSPTVELNSTCARGSYNVNGQGLQDESALIERLDRANPCVVLVMDNFGLAWRLAQRYPDAVVIVRTYSAHEGSQCLKDPPANQVQRFVAEANSYSPQAKSRLVLYGCSNEPSFGGNATLQQIIAKEREFISEANQHGVRVCSGNWAVGTIQPEHVESGLFDDYLRDLIHGNHILCAHEYTTLFLPFGTGLYSRQCLIEGFNLNPPRNDCVQPENWPTRDQIQPRRIQLPLAAQALTDPASEPMGYEAMYAYYSLPIAQTEAGVLPPYWHMFRIYWLWIRAWEIMGEYPWTVMTECCHDQLDDINRENPPALDMLKAAFGMERFTYDLRGAPSHCRLWEAYYYPQWTCAQALFYQWLWWDHVAHEKIIGFTAFTWSWHPQWISFDMSTGQFSMDVGAFYTLYEDCYDALPHCDFPIFEPGKDKSR